MLAIICLSFIFFDRFFCLFRLTLIKIILGGTLEKPEVFKQGSRYGIKLRAKGESIHLIKADVETEVSPIIGNEEQSREFIDRLIADYESEPEKIWDLNIFGRTLSSMVSDGMQNKIYRMPEDAQMKLQETLQKIVNEGSGGLICIIL